MNGTIAGRRKSRKEILEMLKRDDFVAALEEISGLPARSAINALFSALVQGDPVVRGRAAVAVGVVVAELAKKDIGAAREIMRRLVWSLAEESGGIGWGAPLAMGEIMARSGRLAEEFHRVLFSFVDPDGNFLEHEPLLVEAVRGIKRLAAARPDLVKDAAGFLRPFTGSDNSELGKIAVETIDALGGDKTEVGDATEKNRENRRG